MQFKYVNHSRVGFILWPRTDDLFHAHIGQCAIAEAGGKIESAGFVDITNGKVKCFGRSDSLGIASDPMDTQAMARWLGLQPAEAPRAN